MDAMASSLGVVPVVSFDALRRMHGLEANPGGMDNVLVEWSLALELREARGDAGFFVLPAVFGRVSPGPEVAVGDFFAGGENPAAALPAVVPSAVARRVEDFLRARRLGPAPGSRLRERTVREIVEGILASKGILAWTLLPAAAEAAADASTRPGNATSGGGDGGGGGGGGGGGAVLQKEGATAAASRPRPWDLYEECGRVIMAKIVESDRRRRGAAAQRGPAAAAAVPPAMPPSRSIGGTGGDNESASPMATAAAPQQGGGPARRLPQQLLALPRARTASAPPPLAAGTGEARREQTPRHERSGLPGPECPPALALSRDAAGFGFTPSLRSSTAAPAPAPAALPDDLEAWLAQEGLEVLRGNFVREGMCLGAVRLLAEADLDRLRLPVGPRVRLRDAARRLREAGAGPASAGGASAVYGSGFAGVGVPWAMAGDLEGPRRAAGSAGAGRWGESESGPAAGVALGRPQCAVCAVC
jgi:hypothetical protein